MKFCLATLGANAVSILCVICAFILLLKGLGNWQWFLLFGILTIKAVEITEKGGKQ